MTSGGAEALVRDLCIALVANGHEITLCLIRDARSLGLNPEFERRQIERLRARGVDVKFLGSECRLRPWLGAFRLRRMAAQVKPEVVHAHTIWGAAFGALARLKQPIIFTQHTNRLKSVWVHRVWLQRWIRQYVAICQEALDDMKTQLRLQGDWLTKVHNGVVLSRYPVRGVRECRSPRSFVAIGRLSPAKNYEMLISAFLAFLESLSDNARSDVCLHIVGEGELAADLGRHVRLTGMSENVRFHGVRDDIQHVLSGADVYVMASHREGLSISLIEAVATGVPIVATDVGGNREVLDGGKAGCLVPVDQAAFSAALSEVYASSELRQRLVEGCISHRRSFSVELCTQRYTAIYARHIAGG